jgi:hypothetical protein
MSTTYTGVDTDEITAASLPDEMFIVHVGTSGAHFMVCSDKQVLTLAEQHGGNVRIFRVAAAELEYLEVQREIVRESLVPKGEAVLH